MAVIEARELVKDFPVRRRGAGMLAAVRSLLRPVRDWKRAVDHVTFEIEPGEAVGYVGPNGAGKSTTIKLLTGLLWPTEGEARVMGICSSRRRTSIARHIGVVFGQRTQLWWDLPVADSFELLRDIYAVPESEYAPRHEELVELMGLGELLKVPVRQLSLGQRMRAELAAALLHGPGILYLDEPTIGLDVIAKERIRSALAHLNREKGVTILLASHDLDDIDRLCRRVLVIDQGRLVFDGSLDAIKEAYGQERTLVVDLEEDGGERPECSGARLVRKEGARYWFRFARDERTAADVISSIASRHRIIDLTVEEPDIEYVIARIYREAGS
ncbi:MAG TPA: ATP-binding cassette domain-containing protein [Armatimonadota bacterium]|nr:ATP-binding cassette domain-containing protein [Armatimonadota bacterium]